MYCGCKMNWAAAYCLGCLMQLVSRAFLVDDCLGHFCCYNYVEFGNFFCNSPTVTHGTPLRSPRGFSVHELLHDIAHVHKKCILWFCFA